MNRTIKLTLFLLLTFSASTYSQDNYRSGYIITLENDTIRGQIDYRSNLEDTQACLFKNEKSERKCYPNQITGFGYDRDKTYSSQVIEDSFVEVLVVGEISLFKSSSKFYVKKDSTILTLESVIEEVELEGKAGRIDKGKWLGTLIYLTSDCSADLKSLASKLKLQEKSLTTFITKYNKCKGTEFTEFKANIPWSQFDFGTTIGVSRSEILINDFTGLFPYLKSSYTSIDPSIGLIFNISFPRVAKRMSFQSEIHLTKSHFSSLVILEGTFTEYYETSIDLTTISIPISMKYSFPGRKNIFYLQAGLNYDHQLNSNTAVHTEVTYSNAANAEPKRSAFELRNDQIGYWGGLGILRSYEKFRGSLAIRYFQMLSLHANEYIEADNNRISINLILFKK